MNSCPFVQGDLRREVCRSPEPVDAEATTGRQPSAPERTKADDASAEKGRSFGIGEHVRYRVGVVLVHHGALRIAPVGVPTGERGRDTEVLSSARTEPAAPARRSQPG